VDANNHIVNEINQNYKFFEKELSDADKIEKTLFLNASIRETHHSKIP